MIDLFQYDFFVNAIIASILASISCGIIGTYVVTKRMVFISGGISHASFGGIGIAHFLGINPIAGAGVFSVASGLLIGSISRNKTLRPDSMIGILWSLGMATGIIFIYLTPGYAPNLMSYLFGNILTVTIPEINAMAVLTFVIGAFFIYYYRPILYIAFDEEFAETRKLSVKFINMALISLISLTIVLNIRIVGIILVISLLTIPQTIANIFSKNFFSIISFSIIISLFGTITGLMISYWLNIPSGATIIFFLAICYLIARIMKAVREIAFGSPKKKLPLN